MRDSSNDNRCLSRHGYILRHHQHPDKKNMYRVPGIDGSFKSTRDMIRRLERSRAPLSESIQIAIRNVVSAQGTLDGLLKDHERIGGITKQLAREMGLTRHCKWEIVEDAPHRDDAEATEDARSGDGVILHPGFHRRLVAVEYLPMHVVDCIMRDPELMRELSPRDFEKYVACLLEGLDFENVILTPESGDGGRDILATKRVNGISLLFAFECKKYAKGDLIQLNTLRALLGTITHSHSRANIGVLVTTSYFTKGCRGSILSETLIDGKDFDDIVEWVTEYRNK